MPRRRIVHETERGSPRGLQGPTDRRRPDLRGVWPNELLGDIDTVIDTRLSPSATTPNERRERGGGRVRRETERFACSKIMT